MFPLIGGKGSAQKQGIQKTELVWGLRQAGRRASYHPDSSTPKPTSRNSHASPSSVTVQLFNTCFNYFWKPWWKPNITDRSFPLHPAGITEGISCCGASHIPRASPSATEMLKVGQCLSKKDTASGVPTIQPLLCTPGRETKSQREKVISPMLTQEILRHLYPMGYSRTVSWDNADLTQKRRFVPVNIWNSPAVEWLINFRSISIILPISHTFCCT